MSHDDHPGLQASLDAGWLRARDDLPSTAGLLAPSAAHMRLALEASGTGLWTWDLQNDAIEWSPECFRIHGLAPDEQPPHAAEFFELVHGEDRERVEATVRRAIAEGTLYECEFRIVRPAGETAWVQNRGRASYDPDGRPIAMMGTLVDVSSRKRAAAAESELDHLYRSLASQLPGGAVFVVDADLRYRVATGEALPATGGCTDEYEGRRVGELAPDGLGGVMEADYRAALAGRPFRREHQIRGRDYVTHGGPLRAPDGRVHGAVAVSYDITERKAAEDALQLALDAGAIIGTWVWDIAADRFVADALFARSFGMDADRCRQGLPVQDLMASIHPDDLPQVRDAIAAALRRGGPYRRAYRVRRDDGVYRWVEASGRVELGSTGHPVRFPGVLLDVDARHRAEAQRDAAHALLRSFVDAVPGVVYAKDRQGRMLMANRGTAELLGQPLEAVLGRTDMEFLANKQDAAAIMATDRAIMELGEGRQLVEQMALPDGRAGWWLSSKAPLRDAQGRVEGLIGASVDITERVLAEHALAARERELRTLAENIPDIIARFDRDLRHVFVNAAVERATGRPREDFLGRTNAELGMPPQLCEQWDGVLRSVFERDEVRTLEFAFSSPEGTRHFLGRCVPEHGADGRVEHVLAVVSDITIAKAAEEALREEGRRKDEFLATLAHELRNPLAAVTNSVHVLRRLDIDDGRARGSLAVVERQVSHMVRLVEDLLDVARIGQGKVELRPEAVVLQGAIERAVEACRPYLDQAGHALALDLPQAPLLLRADPARLAQVLANLLHNAAKYTPRGGRIEVSAARDADFAVLRVADNGAGIPADMLPRIFELFTQVREHADRAQGGLGIGLSLVRRLVHMHGGTVEVASAGAGRGSVFTVRLPAD